MNLDKTTVNSFEWYFDVLKKHFTCDENFSSFLGYSDKHKLTLFQFFEAFGSNSIKEVKCIFKEIILTGQSVSQFFIINANGKKHLIKLSMHLVENKKGLLKGEITVDRVMPTYEQEYELLMLLFSNANHGMMLASSEHCILMVNKEFCNETGYSESELVGQQASILKSGHYEADFYKQLWSYIDTDKKWHGELLSKNKKGEVYPHEVNFIRIDLPDGSHYYFVDSKKLDVSTSFMSGQLISNTDTTIIPNKQEFIKKIEKEYEQLKSDRSIIVVAFNVQLLQKSSVQMVKWLVVQRFNKISKSYHLGMINDDIFIAFCCIEKNPELIDQSLRALLITLKENKSENTFDLATEINMGVSVLGVDAKSPTQLITHSVQTLIANPHNNESGLYYYDSRLSKRFNQRSIFAKLLQKSLKNNEIEVYYQPIICLKTMKIKKFEALFRLKLETDIKYDTQELINIAEEYNWIDTIDKMVSIKALQALPLIQAHYGDKDIEISINRSLANDKLTHCCLEDTYDLLCNSSVDLSQVTVELTESAFFQDIERQQIWIDRLKEKGVKISIDDFGTGYSSFTYLNKLPVDYIKIDRAFVTGLELESNAYAMIEMLCKLAHQMGAKVIVEGVETEAEFTLVSRAKVDLVQGFLFSRPLSLEKLLSKKESFVADSFSDLLHRPDRLKARNVMRRSSTEFEIAADDRLSLAREKIKGQRYLVVIEGGICLGILTPERLNGALSPYIETEGAQHRDLMTLEKRVHQAMEKEFIRINIAESAETLSAHFQESPDQVLVITDDNKKYYGVITLFELFYQQCPLINPTISTDNI